MDHDRFTGIADPDTLCFCIVDDVDCHVKVRAFVHKNMTVSGSRLNDRNRRILHHGTDQSGASARDQDIHIAIHPHEFFRRLMACITN